MLTGDAGVEREAQEMADARPSNGTSTVVAGSSRMDGPLPAPGRVGTLAAL